MGEHLYADELPARATDALAADGFADFPDLRESELSGEDDDVGELRVEAQRLEIGYRKLCRDVDFEAYAAGVGDYRHVGGDDGIDSRFQSGVEKPPGLGNFPVEKRYIESEIRLDAIGLAYAADLREVLRREIGGGARAHIEVSDAEIDGVGPALDGGDEALEGARRCHYLKTAHRVLPRSLSAKRRSIS